MISGPLEAGNNAHNETISVINLTDNKSFPGSFLKKSKIAFTNQIYGYFSWVGFLLNITDMKTNTTD